MPEIAVAFFATVGCDFINGFFIRVGNVYGDSDCAEFIVIKAVRKMFLDHFRQGIGGKVPVPGAAAKQHIADTTADRIAFITGFFHFIDGFAYRGRQTVLFHHKKPIFMIILYPSHEEMVNRFQKKIFRRQGSS